MTAQAFEAQRSRYLRELVLVLRATAREVSPEERERRAHLADASARRRHAEAWGAFVARNTGF